MKITVLTSSPRRNGTTSLLADEFIRGAGDAGHDVFRFDAAFEDVSPCIACDKCRRGKRRCVYRDAMDKLNPELSDSDAIVFVTPLYYYGMSAQLKTVIDRFYATNDTLRGGEKQAVLLAACEDDAPDAMDALVAHFKAMTSYLRWKNAGMVLAFSCGVRADIERTDYPKQAYELGMSLKGER
jgi:multimeric flavodoxin WrbA